MVNANKVENLKALTSLRFVAAMMIVLHHAPSQFSWAWAKPTGTPLVHGVSFFFVLSGFILAHVYNSKPLPGYVGFMRARFARLWPVHVFSLVLLVLLVRPESVTFDGPGMFNRWVVLGANLPLLHSLVPALSYTFSWNSVSWSISTEMFFYMAFPLLVVNIERTWHWKLVGAAVVVAAYIALLHRLRLPIDSPDVNAFTAVYGTYANPLVRGFEFTVGMATWVLWSRHLRRLPLPSWAWTVAEAAAIWLCWYWLRYGFWLPTVHMNPWTMLWYGTAGSFWVFAILIAVFATGRGWLARALSLSPLVFLGEISFSIYMLHQLLMKTFTITLQWRDVPEVLYFVALFLLASASFLFIEKPGQKLLLGIRLPRKVAPVVG